jgi:DUF2911 family protein
MRKLTTVLCATVLTSVALSAQQGPPASPAGSTEMEIGGKWVTEKGANGRENTVYKGGKWVTITYGRPLKRGRDLWGTGAEYGKKMNAGAPVWRAGANVSTTLKTTAPLVIGDKPLPPGEYLLFIDLKPNDWTLIVSSHKAQQKYDPNNKTEIWGAYGYDQAKDVVRAKMMLNEIGISVEELTWGFTDVTDTGANLNLWWDKVNAVVPVKLGS